MKRYERPEITMVELPLELMACSGYEDIEPGAGDIGSPIVPAKEHSVWEEWDY